MYVTGDVKHLPAAHTDAPNSEYDDRDFDGELNVVVVCFFLSFHEKSTPKIAIDRQFNYRGCVYEIDRIPKLPNWHLNINKRILHCIHIYTQIWTLSSTNNLEFM